MCGHHALLPMAMQIVVSYERMRSASYRGGFADVWKGDHFGRDVAVKVVRTYSDSNLQKVLGVSCPLPPPSACRCPDGGERRNFAKRL